MTGQGGLTDLPGPGDKHHFFVEVHADRRFEVATQIHDPNYTQKQIKAQLNLLIGKKSEVRSGQPFPAIVSNEPDNSTTN
jgi:hypothetical protein